MTWVNQHLKNIRLNRCQIYVTSAESDEIDYFVNQYIKSRKLEDCLWRRLLFRINIRNYPAIEPILKSDIAKYLDRIYKH